MFSGPITERKAKKCKLRLLLIKLIQPNIFLYFCFQLHVNFAQHGATFFAPGSMFSDPPGSRVSTIVYKTLHNVFRLKEKGFSEAQKEGGKLQTISSSIISATVLPTPKFPLAKPVKLVFKRNNQVWAI